MTLETLKTERENLISLLGENVEKTIAYQGITRQEFVKERTRIISEMLDNPNEHEIYPTTKCYEELDELYDRITGNLITKERYEMLIDAHKKGANLAPVDFRSIERYEKLNNLKNLHSIG